MDLPLSVALLMKHPVPYDVLQPLIEALPIDWSTVPTERLVTALIEGSSDMHALPAGKDRLALDLLPRLTWTESLADSTLKRTWAIKMAATVQASMAAAITDAIAPFASPEARTEALSSTLSRRSNDTAPRTATVVERLLTLGCSTDESLVSPFLHVANFQQFEALRAHGFSLTVEHQGQPLVDAIRGRNPDTFNTPSERRNILAALPSMNLPLDQDVAQRLALAQRWSDVRDVLKDVGKDWVNLRFANGDTVLHRVAQKNPEWMLKLFSVPAMKNAPRDIAIDGQGEHLVWSLAHSAGLVEQAQTIEHPAWTGWVDQYKGRPAKVLVGVLQSTLVSSSYWSTLYGLPMLFKRLDMTVDQALEQSVDDPVFQKAFDTVVRNWPSPQHGYYAVEALLKPLTIHASFAPPSLPFPKTWSAATQKWVATHLLGFTCRYIKVPQNESVLHRLIDMGADWDVLDQQFQYGRAPFQVSDVASQKTWSQTLRHHWESQQLSAVAHQPDWEPANRVRL